MGMWSDWKDIVGKAGDGWSSGWAKASAQRSAERQALANGVERVGEAVGGARPLKGSVVGVWRAGRKAVKFGAIGAALAAGAAAVGIMANRSRAAAAGAAQDDIANAPNTVEMPESVIPQMMPPQPVEEPADGRAKGEWVNRVAAERGGLAPQNPAAQPKMSVVPDSAVQDLGSATPAQPAR